MQHDNDDTERAAALAWARFLLNRASVRVRALDDASPESAPAPAPDSHRRISILDAR